MHRWNSETGKLAAARKYGDYVPNEDLRAAVLRAIQRGDITWTGLAADLGVMRNQRKRGRKSYVMGDGQHVKRMLGAKTYTCRGKTFRQEQISYELGEKIVRVLGLDPIDVGL